VGIVVDSVSDVLTLPSESLKPAPDVDTIIDRESVVGLGSLRDRMLILLDIEKLMAGQSMALASDAIN
jgi:purine-binding chemotaxis protein CheW